MAPSQSNCRRFLNKTIDIEANTEVQVDGRDAAPKLRELRVKQRERDRVVFHSSARQSHGVSFYTMLETIGCLMARLAVVTSSQIRGVFGMLVRIRYCRVGLGACAVSAGGHAKLVTVLLSSRVQRKAPPPSPLRAAPRLP